MIGLHLTPPEDAIVSNVRSVNATVNSAPFDVVVVLWLD